MGRIKREVEGGRGQVVYRILDIVRRLRISLK